MTLLPLPFELVATPTTMPYACVLCGDSIGGPFVDTRVNKADGRAYLCASCVHAVIDLYELAAKGDVDVLREERDEARRQRDVSIAELATASGKADGLQAELDQANGELAWRRSERVEFEATLVAQGKELDELRRAGHVTGGELVAQAVADVAAVHLPNGREEPDV
jgi:hypothetical protein